MKSRSNSELVTAFLISTFIFASSAFAGLHYPDHPPERTPQDTWNDFISLIILSALVAITVLALIWIGFWRFRKSRELQSIRRLLVIALCFFISAGCNQKQSDSQAKVPKFRSDTEIMKDLEMDDLERPGQKPRIEPYDGGDLGDYLSSINWGDRSMLILNEAPMLMFELCRSVRQMARDKNLAHHSALQDCDVTMILARHSNLDDPFWKRYRNAEPIPLEDFYEYIEIVAAPGYQRGEQSEAP